MVKRREDSGDEEQPDEPHVPAAQAAAAFSDDVAEVNIMETGSYGPDEVQLDEPHMAVAPAAVLSDVVAEANVTEAESYGPHGCPYQVPWTECIYVPKGDKHICEDHMVSCTTARNACLITPGFQVGPCSSCKAQCDRAVNEAKRLQPVVYLACLLPCSSGSCENWLLKGPRDLNQCHKASQEMGCGGCKGSMPSGLAPFAQRYGANFATLCRGKTHGPSCADSFKQQPLPKKPVDYWGCLLPCSSGSCENWLLKGPRNLHDCHLASQHMGCGNCKTSMPSGIAPFARHHGAPYATFCPGRTIGWTCDDYFKHTPARAP